MSTRLVEGRRHHLLSVVVMTLMLPVDTWIIGSRTSVPHVLCVVPVVSLVLHNIAHHVVHGCLAKLCERTDDMFVVA
jgi:hypothetical protein